MAVKEHTAWVGSDYKTGINGKRVALVGWSHWGEEADWDLGTEHCIEQVMSGCWHINFFTNLRNYFGFDNHRDFWPRVMFFNFLPDLVGDGAHRFGHGTPEQQEAGRMRFIRLLVEHQPEKVLVFTSRRWAFPPTVNCRPINASFPRFKQAVVAVGRYSIPVFFLRHPQGAPGATMREAVKLITHS